MPTFIDQSGGRQQVELNVHMYRQAADVGLTLPQWLARQYPEADTKQGSVFEQLLASEGIVVKANREFGFRPSTMKEIVDGPSIGANTIVKESAPASRILFPAIALQMVEDKLQSTLTMTANAFESMIAFDETINGDRYEQPVVNFDKPSLARHQGVAQLAQPPSMLLLTVSDKAYKLPTFSLGMEISDQALRAMPLDFVAMSLARQAAVERNERAQNYVLQLLNGDVDNNDGSLASLSLSVTTTSLDSAATGGVITHKAWMKYLMLNGTKRSITHIVTDFDTAMKVETRTGKPVITNDDSQTSRIDTQFSLMNPTWAKNPQLFLADSAGISAWPASTIMGLDKSWAIRRVRSLTADFQGIESYVLRRSQAMRFDFGEHVNRMYPEAFQVMTVA